MMNKKTQMKIRVTLTSLLLFAVFLFGCDTSIEEENTVLENDLSDKFEITLEKQREFVISGTEQLQLDDVYKLIEFNDSDTRIAWINNIQNKIFITDTLGNVQTSFGGEGSGPEEFRHISAFGFDDADNLIVYDWNQDLIKTFDESGKLISDSQGLLEDGLWIRSNRLVYNDESLMFGIQESEADGDNIWESATVAEYGKDGSLNEVYGSFGADLIQKDLFYNLTRITGHPSNDWVFVTYRTYHGTDVMSLGEQQVAQRFGVQPENFSYSEEQVEMNDSREERNEKNLAQSFVGDSYYSDQFYYFYFFNFTEEFWDTREPNTRENFLAVYDHSEPFNYYGDIKLPYAPRGITGNGDIYVVENPDPDNFTVGVYRLKVMEI